MAEDQVEIQPCSSIHASIRPPSSKSITNRALICAALAEGRSTLVQPLDSEDTQVMIDSLQRLGIPAVVGHDQVQIQGCGGAIPAEQGELFIGNSGTSVRFLTAMLTLGHGRFTIDGIPRMRQRPIADLLDALRKLGAHVDSETGCPPVTVHAHGIRGGNVSIKGNISSQYLSGLLMAAAYAQDPVTIHVDGELVSGPYVDMTLAIMAEFGVHVRSSATDFVVTPQKYLGREYAIEPDASAASYFWAAAAIVGGEATVEGLNRKSLQGDVDFCDLLVQMGCRHEESPKGLTITRHGELRGIDCNMSDVSDTAQTLSAVALFADGPTTIRGIAHNRHKETDRIGNLAIELRKFGAQVDEWEDGFRVHPPQQIQPAVIDTYDDHRMAMSLALPGLRTQGIVIRNPGCTAKTYPHFFEDLARFTHRG